MPKPNSRVEKWETEEIIFSSMIETKLADVRVLAEIVHPVFSDGEFGEPKLNVTLVRTPKNGKEFALRLMCPKADMSELTSLTTMLNELASKSEECSTRLETRYKIWNDKRIKRYNRQMESHKNGKGSNKGVGEGLSRFTDGSKTKRKREKKEQVK